MRTKSDLVKELESYDLRYNTVEPCVSSSVLTCKNNVYKCCVYFYSYNKQGYRERVRLTINLDSSTKKQADIEAYELKQQCQGAIHSSFISLSKHDLVTSIDRWLTALETEGRLEGTTLETMRNRQKAVNRYFSKHPYAVEDIKLTDVYKFLDWAYDNGSNTGGGLSKSTMQALRGFLFSFFSFALNRGVIQINPCAGLKLPYKKAETTNTEGKCWMDKSEYKAFRQWMLDKIAEYNKNKDSINELRYIKMLEVCDLEVYTGMRREELAGLKWFNFDERNRQLILTASRVRQYGKDVYKNRLKNTSSHRIYTLTDRIMNLLLTIRERQQSLGFYSDDNYIFIYENNIKGNLGKEMSLDYMSREFKRMVRACDTVNGLAELHFHNLRHTCCSILFSLGYSLLEVQSWLGHKDDSAVTNRVYNHYKHIIKEDRLKELDEVWN